MHEDLAGRVRALVEKALSVPVGPEDSTASLSAWDSLAYVGIIAALEEEFGVEFDSRELLELDSVPNIARVLSGKAAAGGGR